MRDKREMKEFDKQIGLINEFGYVPIGPNDSSPVNLMTSKFGKKFDFEQALDKISQ